MKVSSDNFTNLTATFFARMRYHWLLIQREFWQLMKPSRRHLNRKTVTIYVRRPGSRIVTGKNSTKY